MWLDLPVTHLQQQLKPHRQLCLLTAYFVCAEHINSSTLQAMAAATGKVPGHDWTVVTGSNRGLGYGVAKHLVEEGRGVVMAARTQQSGWCDCSLRCYERTAARFEHLTEHLALHKRRMLLHCLAAVHCSTSQMDHQRRAGFALLPNHATGRFHFRFVLHTWCSISVALRAADEASARLVKETGKPDIIGAVALDTSKPESISAAVHNLVKGFEGKLDTLINNAAVSTHRPAARCCRVTDGGGPALALSIYHIGSQPLHGVLQMAGAIWYRLSCHVSSVYTSTRRALGMMHGR